MNTRILTSALSILTVVGAVSAGTWAYFSSSTVNASNLFSTGSLSISIAKPVSTPLFNISGTLPGDTRSGCMAIVNDGAIEEKWRAYLTDEVGQDILRNQLTATVTMNPTGACIDERSDLTNLSRVIAGTPNLAIYSGPLSDMVGADSNKLVWNDDISGPFMPNWAAIYKIDVTLKPEATSTVANTSYGANIKIDATQTTNPGWN